MILTTHILAGAVIGESTNNLWLIIPAAILGHFALDAIPHSEYIRSFEENFTLRNTWWKVGLDLLFGLFIITLFILCSDYDLIKIENILIGVLFSILPDFLNLLYWKFGFKFLEKIHNFHHWVHRSSRNLKNNDWNIRNAKNDIIISIIALILLFA